MTQTTHAAPDAATDPRIDRRIPTASSMMAWRVHEYGPPNVMKFERIPRPDPGRGEVLVKVTAAGSVGAYAVQLARQAGLHVIATASADDAALVRELGADTVIDYRTELFEDSVRGADAVIDLVGGDTQKRSFQVLRRGGKLISA